LRTHEVLGEDADAVSASLEAVGGAGEGLLARAAHAVSAEAAIRRATLTADLGRCFTANAHAVAALTYGAMLAHALVGSVRIQAALVNEIPLEELRPLASLHVVRAYGARQTATVAR
jgi:hypothetical protein